ncbi:hypothetical protein E4U42_001308 [Claviceps africana]|uniref:Methyltransferase domain-containing protein n=1 Tax=Claviceps africana TaxID=83212 RepID=A0A8K0JA02_9HYPO|nr:hypothetical protein E4U42_001308 [Claviceps africana]
MIWPRAGTMHMNSTASSSMLTLPDEYDNPETYTDHLCDFVSTPLVRQITGGIHVNDALIHDAWQKLPHEWTAWWSSWPDHRLAQQDLIDGIDQDGGPGTKDHAAEPGPVAGRPQSLTRWLDTLKSLALPRTKRRGPVLVLPEALSLRMKTKKSAEVSRAVAYIHGVCQQKAITRIVDMGSGQGYLSINLAYLFPHLRLLCIDGSQSQVAGSQALARSLGIPESRLKAMVRWIDGGPALAATIEEWADGEKCMLVGLHACGSLTEHMLRYFTTLRCVDAIAAIGCCYNHITPRSPSHPTGFPISAALRQHGVVLSPTALMTACQSPNNWTRPDTQPGPAASSVFSKRRLYRAILEKIFHDKGVQVGNADGDRPIWGTRKGDLATFTTFAHRAMDCLGIERGTIPTAELAAYEERYGHREGQIAILWTLSVLCCKVVESLIAMDRFWFLREAGAQAVGVVPIFDARISPRNLMLVAEKPGMNLFER